MLTRVLGVAIFVGGCASTKPSAQVGSGAGEPTGRGAVSGAVSDGDPAEELYSDPVEYRARPVSADAGRFYFSESGVGDPYAAGVPYPIFLALMRKYPDKLGKNWLELSEKFGFIPNPDAPQDPNAIPVGFHLTEDPNTQTQFVMMNCQICHSARIGTSEGERVVLGMGNKRLRIHDYDAAWTDIARDPDLDAKALNRLAAKIARKRGLNFPGEWQHALTAGTVRNMQKRAAIRGPEVDRLKGGLPGRVATIEGFSMALNFQHGAELKTPGSIGWVKIPDVAVWRYRDTNSFDGIAIGSPVTLVAEADFTFGVRPKWYQTHVHIPTSMFLFLKNFTRELPYPGTIDPKLANEGYVAFNETCARCHGDYASPGQVANPRVLNYTEHLIPIQTIQTDPTRLDAVTQAFVDYSNSIRETEGLVTVRETRSYVPRPLNNVWARGLYGHNGQCPSIAALATPPEQRPRRYVVQPTQPYDVEAMGVAWRTVTTDAGGERLEAGEYLYDAESPGFGAGGHHFLSDLPEAKRRAVIEYLKTL